MECTAFAVAALLVLMPRWIAMTYLELDNAPATLIGIACLGIAFGILVLRIRREDKCENTVLSTHIHPAFGEVRVYRNCWVAAVSIPGWPPPLDFTGITPQPTMVQTATLRMIQARLPDFLNAAAQAIQEIVHAPSPVIRVTDLVLENIHLEADLPGHFSIFLSLPEHADFFWAGVSVEFNDGKVTHVEVLH